MKTGKIVAVLAISLVLAFVGCTKNEPAMTQSPPQEGAPMEDSAKQDTPMQQMPMMEDVASQGSTDVMKGMMPDLEMNFTLKDHAGQDVSLSDFAGKIVVLEWLNYDCPFDKPHYESGDMQKLARKWMDQDVVWLAINSTNYATVDTNKDFAKEHNVPHRILDDSKGMVGRMFGAKTTPHMFILHKNGEIVYEGAFDNAPRGKVPAGEEYVNYVDQALMELTSGQDISMAETKPYGCTVKYAELPMGK